MREFFEFRNWVGNRSDEEGENKVVEGGSDRGLERECNFAAVIRIEFGGVNYLIRGPALKEGPRLLDGD